ncbi:hypothetical protein C8R43DRAFT_1129480 [Mycena crocata]|nr:hypothetical protein C8R43DRAFT_1129480 [Mycena crocata]
MTTFVWIHTYLKHYFGNALSRFLASFYGDLDVGKKGEDAESSVDDVHLPTEIKSSIEAPDPVSNTVSDKASELGPTTVEPDEPSAEELISAAVAVNLVLPSLPSILKNPEPRAPIDENNMIMQRQDFGVPSNVFHDRRFLGNVTNLPRVNEVKPKALKAAKAAKNINWSLPTGVAHSKKRPGFKRSRHAPARVEPAPEEVAPVVSFPVSAVDKSGLISESNLLLEVAPAPGSNEWNATKTALLAQVRNWSDQVKASRRHSLPVRLPVGVPASASIDVLPALVSVKEICFSALILEAKDTITVIEAEEATVSKKNPEVKSAGVKDGNKHSRTGSIKTSGSFAKKNMRTFSAVALENGEDIFVIGDDSDDEQDEVVTTANRGTSHHNSGHVLPTATVLLASVCIPPHLLHLRLSLYGCARQLTGCDIGGNFDTIVKVQDYADGLRAAVSTVRALPAEILGEIFTPFSRSQDSRRVEGELEGLAKAELLDLHISTASKNIHERGEDHPLAPFLRIVETQDPALWGPALTLLAEHSQRWQRFSFVGYLAILSHIPHIRSKLHSLEMLLLDFWEETAIDIFEYPVLPWHQLRSVICNELNLKHLSAIMALMQNLSHPNVAFELRDFNTDSGVSPDLPVIVSTISSFLLEVSAMVYPHRNARAGQIFRCLTLPRLHELFVSRATHFKDHIPWPTIDFESFSSRSSLRGTLRVLEIPHVLITEEGLLRALGSLASLQRLVIGDQPKLWENPVHILITDTLLSRLTRTPDSQLIPRLTHFTCTSLFKFSADVYFEFVASRITPGEEPFRCGLRYFADSAHEFDLVVHQKLLGLAKKKELEFSIVEEKVVLVARPNHLEQFARFAETPQYFLLRGSVEHLGRGQG